MHSFNTYIGRVVCMAPLSELESQSVIGNGGINSLCRFPVCSAPSKYPRGGRLPCPLSAIKAQPSSTLEPIQNTAAHHRPHHMSTSVLLVRWPRKRRSRPRAFQAHGKAELKVRYATHLLKEPVRSGAWEDWCPCTGPCLPLL